MVIRRQVIKWALRALAVSSSVVLLATLYTGSEHGSTAGLPQMDAEQLTGEPITLRRDVARELQSILADLHRAIEHRMPPEGRTLLALERTLGHLDPRFQPLETTTLPSQQQPVVRENVGDGGESMGSQHPLRPEHQQETLLEVCPEVYMGRDYDPPYHTNAFHADCHDAMALRDLVTVAVDATRYDGQRLKQLLQDINSWSEGVPVVVAAASDATLVITHKYTNVRSVRVTTSTPVAVRWARLLGLVHTKYVVVGRRLHAFSSFTDLGRLLRALRQVPYAAYIAGATRNETGNWRVECFQSRMEQYDLTLQQGYTSSASECMYCDAVEGPFLTTTKLVASVPIDERLPDEVVFSDWFLRVQANGSFGLACPDVLFFVSDSYHRDWENHQAWEAIALKWGITDLHLPGRVKHHYTCLDAGLNCGTVGKDLALPPCCLARLTRALKEVVDALEKQGVAVHIIDKTAVAGVKGSLQPWEAETHLATQNIPLEIQKAVVSLRQRGYTVEITDSVTYHIHAYSHTVYLHLFNVNQKTGLPLQQAEIPTIMYVGNTWLPGPPNPGLYARGLRGPGGFKHQPSGRSWPPCPVPGHHACLDRLPYDGSLTRLQ